MKNNLFVCLFILFSATLKAQTEILVLDAFEKTPLSQVEIYVDKVTLIGSTAPNGTFEITTDEYPVVLLTRDGYKSRIVKLDRPYIHVYLEPEIINLNPLSFGINDTEAREIIKASIRNQKVNSIKNLESYQYKSYTKFWADVNKDSIPIIHFPLTKKDSAKNELLSILDKSLLFLGEKATDHLYSKKYGVKNKIQASRISGIKTPLYELAVFSPISHNFDEDYIKFLIKKFPNPVSDAGLAAYKYNLDKITEYNGRETAIISYYPARKSNEKQIKGNVWIDIETKSLMKFFGENTDFSNLAELEAEWVFKEGYWFPFIHNFIIDGGFVEYNKTKEGENPDEVIIIKDKEPIWVNIITYFKDIQTDVEFSKKDFVGYEDEIISVDDKDWNAIMERYRIGELTDVEQDTYSVIDSVGTKYRVDRNLKYLRILSSGGKLDLGKVDTDLTKILSYNDYEGFRLGAAFNTNAKFSQDYSLNAYGAYGFKDKAFKYGIGANYYVNKPYSGRIFANYSKDISAAGRLDYALQSNYSRFVDGTLSNLSNNYFFDYNKVELGYEQDFLKNLTFNLSTNYEKQEAGFKYRYKNEREWEFYTAQLALRWAPKDKYVRTPYGKVTIQNGKSVFYLTLNQSFGFGDNYTPTRINFSYFDTYRTYIGETKFSLHAGIVTGDTPITNSFEGRGNSRLGEGIGRHIGIAGMNMFETMTPSEFYSDRFISFQIKHKIAGFKLFNEEIYPELIYRGAFGDMDKTESHEDIRFNTLKNYYQEGGVEFNNLFFKTFGLGAYYRFGSYHLESFKNNIFLKLTVKMPFLY